MTLFRKSEYLPFLIASLVTLALFLAMTLLGSPATAQSGPGHDDDCSTLSLFGGSIGGTNRQPNVSITLKEYNTDTSTNGCAPQRVHSLKLYRTPAWEQGNVRTCDISGPGFNGLFIWDSANNGWKPDRGHSSYSDYTALPCSLSLSSRSMRDDGPFEPNLEYRYNIGIVMKVDPNTTHWWNSAGESGTIGLGIVRRTHGVRISPTSLSLDEGGASGFYEVRLDTEPSANVTVSIAEDGDVTLSHSSLTFTPSNWRKQTVTVNSVQDADALDDIVPIEHTVSSDDSNYNGISAPDVNVTINDDETAEVIISPTELSVTEGRSSGYNVRLGTPPSDDVTVSFNTSNSKLSLPTSTTTLTFTPSSYGNKRVSVTAAQDTDADNDTTTISHSVSGATEYSGIRTDDVTVSIRDDEVLVKVSFGSDTYTVNEGSRRAITVNLDKDPKRTVVIPIARSNQGGATDQDNTDPDYSGVPENVTFNSGQRTRTFNISAVDDTDDDDNESVLLSFGSLPLHVSKGTVNETTVSISDNDYPLINVSFGLSSYTVDEGATTTISFSLTDQPQRRISIPLRRTNQGGASSSDYSVPSSVVFESDETVKTIIFLARDDTIDDDDESVTLSFESSLPDNVSVDSPDTATVNITDNDDPQVSVRFEKSSDSVDEGSSLQVKVLLNADPERTIEIPISTTTLGGATEDDYSAPSSVRFFSGDTSTSFTFNAIDDGDDDDGNQVRLSFGDLPERVGRGSPSQTTISIVDDENPDVSVSFGADTYDVNEGSNVRITVTLSADPERTVVIPLSTTRFGGAIDDDFSLSTTSLSFVSGDTSEYFTFTATEDTSDDDGESVEITWGTLPVDIDRGTHNETTVSINDDDYPEVTVRFGQAADSVVEGSSTTVSVILDREPQRQVRVSLRRTSDSTASTSDYSVVPSSVTFNSDEMRKDLTFTATDDSSDEDEMETVRFFFSNLPTGVSTTTPDQTTITIEDNDDPPVRVRFRESSHTLEEGESVEVEVFLNKAP